jgi:DNA mismatch repair protein MutS2
MTSIDPEIMLRRLTVDEALLKLDQGLYDLFMAGFQSVRVVHGKGTGTLRLAVRRELANHTLVESFRPAESWEGGAGVTIVQLSRK